MISFKVLSSLKSMLVTSVLVLFLAACGAQAHNHGGKQNIVEIAAGNPDFSTLVAAVKAAGLVETLQGPGPFTVFAPTNEAFAKLPAGTVESLLKPENKNQLVAILTYHVVPGKVMASDVVGLSEAKTVQGSKVKIDSSNGVKVDNANVVATDIEASNGVIHVIDSVIIPQ
ncbi:fasciclin domain-containing protein [Grimontia kaedaensis]|uniref:Fasciclin domain-containing protein n=1 Tax=Grimontia kaedaensis TaxID=2872157 RepID=A0ABY4WX89_9GAMM|nr:fasciclin domain-containing protein [Grimontia kaedaensis]USH03594.1 fasciclin domain-containing protein [Grimontia kaedaensis]